MTPGQRAAWLADARAILDAFEAHPDLPVPYISRDVARFYLTAASGPAARRAFAAAETALTSPGRTFAGAVEDAATGDSYYYDLTAVMPGGLPVVIRAVASEVAERKVTGQAVTGVTEWVRRRGQDRFPPRPYPAYPDPPPVQPRPPIMLAGQQAPWVMAVNPPRPGDPGPTPQALEVARFLRDKVRILRRRGHLDRITDEKLAMLPAMRQANKRTTALIIVDEAAELLRAGGDPR